MAIRLKSNIAYKPMVEEVSRKFVPRKETCAAGGAAGPVTIESTGWMGGAVKTLGRAGLGITKRNFLVVRQNARSSAVTADELEARALFKQVNAAAYSITHDLQQISRVQQMFIQAGEDKTKLCNGISAYGYTMKGWVFAVQYAGKKDNPSYNVNTFPSSFDA